jgi:hypothetical protein
MDTDHEKRNADPTDEGADHTGDLTPPVSARAVPQMGGHPLVAHWRAPSAERVYCPDRSE